MHPVTQVHILNFPFFGGTFIEAPIRLMHG